MKKNITQSDIRLLSLVIPAYNESAGIADFHSNIFLPTIQKLGIPFEILYVNDGSKDDTLIKLLAISSRDSRVKIINLSRNYGKEIAVTAGIHHAKGDVTITLDADGQHPPELISKFIERWRRGAQVVVGVRKTNHNEGLVKKYGSKLFYALSNNVVGSGLTPGATDFCLINAEVKATFNLLTERPRITRGLIDWMGYDRDYIYFSANPRLADKASYKFSKLFDLALNSFVSQSSRPLRLPFYIGGLIIILSLALTIFCIVEIIIGDPFNLDITGTAFLVLLNLFLMGFVLMAQGILALYLAHIHTETQNRPLYIINSRGTNLHEK